MQASTPATYPLLLPAWHRSRHLYMASLAPLLSTSSPSLTRAIALVLGSPTTATTVAAQQAQQMSKAMAERDYRGGGHMQRPVAGDTVKGMLSEKAPSASQALTVATLFPLGGLLLLLSGLALAASVVGLAVAAPVFLLFSPVLVPAALLIALAVAGFLTSGALGLGGLSSLSCLASTARQAFQRTPDYVEQARRRMAEAAAHAGHKTAQAGHAVQNRAQEAGAGTGGGAGGGGRASS